MIRFSIFTFCFFSVAQLLGQQNQVPVLSNLSALVNWSDQTIHISYDLADAEQDAIEIIVHVSDNNGVDYDLTSQLNAPSGAVGFPVTVGTDKKITIPTLGLMNSPIRVRLTALDRQPLDLYALVAKVDSQVLKNRLLQLEGVRHRTAGTAKLQDTRDSIYAHFDGLQLGVSTQSVNYNGYTGYNYIGNKEGILSPKNVVIVDAHYDTVANSPGADDNGSGTAAVLEISKILAPYPSLKTLRFIGFDLEETGLTGSTAYVQNMASDEQIAGVFNFEMIGFYSEEKNAQTLPTGFNLLFPAAYNSVAQDSFRGNFITNVGNGNSSALVDLFHQSAQTYVPSLKVVDVVSPGNGTIAPDLLRSDHAPFWLAGHSALMLTDGANFRNNSYHTTGDKSDKLNFGFMQKVTQATLAAAAELAELQHGSWQTIVAEETLDANDFKVDCQTVFWKNDGVIQLNIGTCALSEQVSIQVFSLDGKLLHSEENRLQNQSQITLKGRFSPEQAYFVRISGKNGRIIWSQKVF